jgi:hypothetical protein
LKPEETPEVVDLRRYRAAQRKAAEVKAAQAKAARQAAGRGESLLGGRRNAGLILLAVLAVLLALWVLPVFL